MPEGRLPFKFPGDGVDVATFRSAPCVESQGSRGELPSGVAVPPVPSQLRGMLTTEGDGASGFTAGAPELAESLLDCNGDLVKLPTSPWALFIAALTR